MPKPFSSLSVSDSGMTKLNYPLKQKIGVYMQNYNYSDKKKGSKAKVIISIIAVVLVLTLSLGVVNYFFDIKSIFTRETPVVPAVPKPDEPKIPVVPDEPKIPVVPDEPVIPEEPKQILRLASGSNASSIYLDTENFDTVVKSMLLDLEYNQSPEYMGLGYKFLSVPVEVGDTIADFEFAVVPFFRLYDNLVYDAIPEEDGISEDDLFMLIYAPYLNDWAFNNVFYSSVNAELVFEIEEGSLNLSFDKGFRDGGFDSEGKILFEETVSIEIVNRYGFVDYMMSHIVFVDSVISPVLFAAETINALAFNQYNSLGNLYLKSGVNENCVDLSTLSNDNFYNKSLTIHPQYAEFFYDICSLNFVYDNGSGTRVKIDTFISLFDTFNYLNDDLGKNQVMFDYNVDANFELSNISNNSFQLKFQQFDVQGHGGSFYRSNMFKIIDNDVVKDFPKNYTMAETDFECYIDTDVRLNFGSLLKYTGTWDGPYWDFVGIEITSIYNPSLFNTFFNFVHE